MSGQNQKTDKRIAWPIIIMNFTGVYDYEAFARNNKFIWLDCRHLYGTDGYCNRDAFSVSVEVIMQHFFLFISDWPFPRSNK